MVCERDYIRGQARMMETKERRDAGGLATRRQVKAEGKRRRSRGGERERERPSREVGGGWKGYEGAAGSAALIKLAEDNEPVCRLACLAV